MSRAAGRIGLQAKTELCQDFQRVPPGIEIRGVYIAVMVEHFGETVRILEHIDARRHALAGHECSQHTIACRVSRVQRFCHRPKISPQAARR